VASRQRALAAAGTQVAFVHMHPEAQAAEFFDRYGVADLPRVSDPGQRLYQAFGIGRVTPTQWLRPRVILRYLATLRAGHRPALAGGNVLRMPGAFLLEGGRIAKAFRPDTVADRLDLDALSARPPAASTGPRPPEGGAA
jgi:hypothetical protein